MNGLISAPQLERARCFRELLALEQFDGTLDVPLIAFIHLLLVRETLGLFEDGGEGCRLFVELLVGPGQLLDFFLQLLGFSFLLRQLRTVRGNLFSELGLR